jgi:beta-glucosidase
VLAQLTLDEKVALAADGQDGVPRLGVPALNGSDGPNGVRGGGPGKTAFPNAQVLAASWDTALAERFGSAVGAEAAGKGFNLVLGPTVNILRTPKWGRAAETLGEDPFLAGQLAAAEIRAMQREHVMAEVKHFAANNQEINRWGRAILQPAVNVLVSERALQEIYFPAFRTAVEQGRVASVMCSYNRLNGLYACENPALLGTLKDAWGFAGFVEPDALVAVRDPLAAANAGTDQFALGSFGSPPVDTALRQISAERLDDMVRRILTAMFSVGLFDHPNTGHGDAVVSTPEHIRLAAEIGAQGSVLLKNDGPLLPLGSDVGSIAVIGYDAGSGTQMMEGGSPAVIGGPVVSPLDAITARAGDGTTVRYAAGTLGVVPLPIVPASVLTPSSGPGSGLFGTYYAGEDWSGTVLRTEVVQTLDAASVLGNGPRSARWTGTLTPPASGTYRFALDYAGIARLFIDGVLVASGHSEGLERLITGTPLITAQAFVPLSAGVAVPIAIEYAAGPSVVGSPLHLGWQPPDPAMLEEAVTAAAMSDVAVVFVNDVTSEGMDRDSLVLPGDQDALIAAVAAVNPHTIVVLHTSGPVLMPWLADVPAVIQAWYPGQETGHAIAAVLFGDVAPAGRLPMTFPASESQGPAQQPSQYPGIDDSVSYDEGIYVGYRYYDQNAQEPLFPFGYGLTYTTFALDGLEVVQHDDGSLAVSVAVTNTGGRAGAAVVQLYVGFPAAAEEPPNQLKGFTKVVLAPAATQRVTMRLDRSSLSAWDAETSQSVVHPGTYTVRVGTSSRDLPQEATVSVD